LLITNVALIVAEIIYVLLLSITWMSKKEKNWRIETTKLFIVVFAMTIGMLIVLDVGTEFLTLAVFMYYLWKKLRRGRV
jgi:multisubunit Na+/H+ antiporter MnhB subunit